MTSSEYSPACFDCFNVSRVSAGHSLKWSGRKVRQWGHAHWWVGSHFQPLYCGSARSHCAASVPWLSPPHPLLPNGGADPLKGSANGTPGNRGMAGSKSATPSTLQNGGLFSELRWEFERLNLASCPNFSDVILWLLTSLKTLFSDGRPRPSHTQYT